MLTLPSILSPLLLAFNSVAGQSEPPQLGIGLEKPEYLLGETVILRVEISNPGSEPLLFLSDPNGWGPYWRINVNDESGKRVRYLGGSSDWRPPRKAELFSLEVGASRIFDYDLSGNFDLSTVGEYTISLLYDASPLVDALRLRNPEFGRITAVLAVPATANFRIADPERDEEQALARLFSGSRRARTFERCCWEVAHLEDFLSQYPGSAYAPYARFWLARAISLGAGPARGLEQYELVKKGVPGTWLAASAQLEIARIYERLNRRVEAASAYKRLSEHFAGSPFVQKAEDRIRALAAARQD